MDSSNAEKAWKLYTRWWGDWFRPTPEEAFREGFFARELEVLDLREQLAAAEAVIEKVRDAWHADTGWVEFGESVRAILPVTPSSVLADVKADAWDEGYGDDLEATTPRRNPYRTGDTNA